MASEAAVVVLALIGIGVIVVGIMNLVTIQRPTSVVKVEDDTWSPDSWQWRGHYYSHLPVRPVIYG